MRTLIIPSYEVLLTNVRCQYCIYKDKDILLWRFIRFYLGKALYINLRNFVTLKDSKYSLRYENILEIPRITLTKYGINSFRYTAAKVWNALPSEYRSACDFTKFKGMIKNSWNVKMQMLDV